MKKIVSERKIKHWQGYGTVDAKVLRKTPDNLIVQVRGMHERGLVCSPWDHDLIYEWLVKRFDPTKTADDIVSVDIDDDYERQGNVDVEVCTYDISFEERYTFDLVQESADDETLKDIESTYGKKTALALYKYCKLFKKNPTNVVSDLKADGNGMTEWDKFDVWAKRKLKVDIMDNFDDTVDWTGAEDEKKREKEFAKAEKLAAKGKGKGKRGMKKGRFGDVYSAPTDFSTMEESTEREMDSEFIADWIVDVMHKERLGRLGLIKTEGDGSARFTLKTEDGGLFSITVNDIG